MADYFISDLHLQPSKPNLYEGLRKFLNQIDDAESLYILGDFYDAWIGDDEDHPFYVDTLDTLRSISDSGISLYFQHGNRDFLVGKTFSERTGATLLPEQKLIELAGKNVMLMHGDSLCSTDTEYMAFREQVRDPIWQQQILSLPLQQRRQMAEQLRAQSKSMNSNKAEDIMDVNPTDVDALFKANDISILLHGHTHRPNRHQLDDNKERIVLGDWGETAWYVRADETTLDLVEFSI